VKYLKKELEKSIDITGEEWGLISSKFKPKSVKKGEIAHYTIKRIYKYE